MICSVLFSLKDDCLNIYINGERGLTLPLFPFDPGPEDGRDLYHSLLYARVKIRYFPVKAAL